MVRLAQRVAGWGTGCGDLNLGHRGGMGVLEVGSLRMGVMGLGKLFIELEDRVAEEGQFTSIPLDLLVFRDEQVVK